MKALRISVYFIIFIFLFNALLYPAKRTERYLVRIRGSKEMLEALSRKNFDFASMAIRGYMDAILTDRQIDQIIAEGFQIEILKRESDLIGTSLDPQYHTYEETVAYLKKMENSYPNLSKIYIIGESTRFGFPIYAMKISDNVDKEEEEIGILIDGMHHAREPLGNEVCLSFINYLLTKYGMDEKVTQWVNKYEIWIIPILNPEGYKYITDNNLSYPWWRKNLRDNNNNGEIDPDYDGVDLNRNYDLNWNQGGSSDPSSWTYRGPYPFSEKETKAKRDLVLKRNFALAISYHSYGEVILYPWSWPGTGEPTPDNALIQEIASELARRIKNEDGDGTYSYRTTHGASKSLCWMYGVPGVIELLVELGTSFIPPGNRIQPIVNSNLKGLFYIMDRASGAGTKVKVMDVDTGEPICANVRIGEIDNFNYIIPRFTNPYTGIHVRLLQKGKYTLIISAFGYITKRIKVNVGEQMKCINVYLPKIEEWKMRRLMAQLENIFNGN